VDTVSDALPFTSVTTPREVPPSLKVTVPVGTPAAGEVADTVAVNVTVCPTFDGFGVEVRLVLVFPWFTVCVTVADVLAWKFPPPL